VLVKVVRFFPSLFKSCISLRLRLFMTSSCMLPQMFYPLKHFLLSYLVILKQSCNNIISTLIIYLYASCVCLHILASLRIPRSIFRRRNPHFLGGFVTTSIRIRSGLNAHSKHLKIVTTFTVRTLSPYKDYSSLLRW
jgi:hypothetical protein